jgi:parallel beta-helix repeat protein
VRERVITILFLGAIIIGISSVLPITCLQQVAAPRNIASPSQSTESIIIVGNVQLSQRSTGGIGTRSEPYLISGRTITSSTSCISIQDTTAFFLISDCDLKSEQGVPVIVFDNVENGAIENCYITGGTSGVFLTSSTDCVIKQSTIFYNSNIGIDIRSSDNCSISECKIYLNWIGVWIEDSSSIFTTNSSIYSNYYRGLSIASSAQNSIVYGNKFGWNDVNAYNEGQNSAFTNGIDTGNAWSDYNSSGVYQISGSIPTTDVFASLLTDTVKPYIDSPFDVVYDAESNGETLTWEASDDFPSFYLLYIDDVPQDTVYWDGREITISLDGIPAGTYTFVMYVYDAAGNSASDEVIVTAVYFMLGGLGTEMVMWASALTVLVLVLVVVIIKKMP